MTAAEDETVEKPTEPASHKNKAPRILAVVGVLLVLYYVIVLVSGALSNSTKVPLSGEVPTPDGNYLTLQMKVQDVDLTNRVIQANVLPIPHGDLVGERPGEMSKSLRIEVRSGGLTTSVVTFPGESIVDPTSVGLTLDRGDTSFPFDRPFADFHVSVQDDETGADIPFKLAIENSSRPWTLEANLDRTTTQDGLTVQPVTLDGSRDALSITLVLFYMMAILLTTLMAVVTIGSALLKKELQFSNVIWLSATMISFPALRSAAPGAPPIGTALDYLIFFPCFCLVAGMLMWTGAYLLWTESSILRSREISDARD